MRRSIGGWYAGYVNNLSNCISTTPWLMIVQFESEGFARALTDLQMQVRSPYSSDCVLTVCFTLRVRCGLAVVTGEPPPKGVSS